MQVIAVPGHSGVLTVHPLCHIDELLLDDVRRFTLVVDHLFHQFVLLAIETLGIACIGRVGGLLERIGLVCLTQSVHIVASIVQ